MDGFDLTEKLGSLGRSLALEICETRDFREFQRALTLFHRVGLEPIMEVAVVSPDDILGDVIGHLNSHHGQIQGAKSHDNAHTVETHIKLTNMFGYAEKLCSFSRGRAQCTVRFSHFAEVQDDGGPPDTEPAVVAKRA